MIAPVRYLSTRPGGAGTSATSAEAILAERYACGEIDDQEYQQSLATLPCGAKPPSAPWASSFRAMDAGLTSGLFWGALAFSLLVAFVLTTPVNRWMVFRGGGHTVVHQYHHAH